MWTPQSQVTKWGFPFLLYLLTVGEVQSRSLGITCNFEMPFSPQVVPNQRKHPGRGWGDAGGAVLVVLHPDHLRPLPALGPLRPLAGHHYLSGQHRHAAVWHRRGEPSAFSVFVWGDWTHFKARQFPAGFPPIYTSVCLCITGPHAAAVSLSRGHQYHASLSPGPFSHCRLIHKRIVILRGSHVC